MAIIKLDFSNTPTFSVSCGDGGYETIRRPEVGKIWKGAENQYEEITKVKIEAMVSIDNVDEVYVRLTPKTQNSETFTMKRPRLIILGHLWARAWAR